MEKRYQNRDPQLETSGKIIGFYSREFYCFSNFSSFAVKWEGKTWLTSEHAYQASRFFKSSLQIVRKIFNARSAHDAKKISEKYSDKATPDFCEDSIMIMEDIVRHKLKQHPYIMHKLIQTGKRLIIEDSPKDDFWGWGLKRNGRNELGKIWMKLRDEIVN